jgi:hypothetical protein
MTYTCIHKWVPENQWITKWTHAIISCNVPVEDSGVPEVQSQGSHIVYHSTFNSIINYSLPFCSTSPNSKKIFRMQKRIVRIMLSCRRLASCRNLFKKLKILPLMSQYIFSTMVFIIKNKRQFTVNSEIHNINARQHTDLHQPALNLTRYEQCIYYSGVKIYNNLPPHIKQLLDNPTTFELKLKNFLYLHSFYLLEEYFQHQLNF